MMCQSSGLLLFFSALLGACLLCHAAAVHQLDSLEIPDNSGMQFQRAERGKDESGDYQTREILQYLSHLMKTPAHREPYWLVTLKRGLDLGLGRGFSGSQAAKHLMGKAVADFAYGPGRKRRYIPKPQIIKIQEEQEEAS